MAAIDVSIASRALVLLGEDPISSFDDNSNAQTAGELYPSTRAAVLTCYTWACTKKKAQLNRLTAAPESQWTYAFQLPPGFLRITAAYPSAAVGVAPIVDYEIFGDKLLTNAADVWLDYQGLVDESAWPPYLRKLMEYAFASEMAMPVTDQVGKADYWERKAWGNPSEGLKGGWFRIATTAEAQAQPSSSLMSSASLVDVRS